MNDLVTIIMPLNNAITYINESIETVKQQSYKNFELLIIKTNTHVNIDKIINFHSKNDSRIRIITKKTKNIENLKNIGIKESKGEFICFMEAGDKLEKEYITKLKAIQNKTKADIISSELIIDKKNTKSKKINIYKNNEIMEAYVNLKIRSNAKGKLFKKELFNEIEYPVSAYDNFLITYQIFHKCQKLVHTDLKLYKYIPEKNERISDKEHMKKLEGCLEMLNFIEKNYQYLSKKFNTKLCFEAIDLTKKMKKEENKKYLFEYIKLYRKYAILDIRIKPSLRLEAVKSLLGYNLFKMCIK